MTTTITVPGTVSTFAITSPNAIATNAGTQGGTGASDPAGITILGATDTTLINTGKIFGGTASQGFGYTAIYIASSGVSVINQAGATIAGGANGVSGVYFNVNLGGPDTPAGPGTVINFGTITANAGGAGYGTAVSLEDGGFVSNATGGVLSGGNGVFVANAAGTVTNAGTILGNAAYGAINMNTGGMVTNLTGGTIAANGAAYGVYIDGAAGTVTNAGIINGGSSGFAVELAAGYANRVIVDHGAVFVGTVSGGAAASGSTLELTSFAGIGTLGGFGTSFTNFGTVAFDTSASWVLQTNTAAISSATIDGFVSTDTIDIIGFTATSISTIAGGTGVILTDAASHHATLSFGAPISNFGFTTGPFGTELTTICFCVGTLIDTPDGEVQVEKLKQGDMVLTAHNGPRAVKWVGRGKVLATRGKRTAATPVIVRKGALADNVPNQDLHVTKAHSLYIDNVLIPVEFLVNHKTILWDDRAQEVEIYHVELDSHDVLLANGAAAESYRDDGNRWLFQNANAGWHLPPQEPCAPVLTGGPVVDAVWQLLMDRAGPRRLPPMTDHPDLHLIVDGQRVEVAERTGLVFVFRLVRRPGSIHLVSREVVPAELGLARDPRSLGVALRLMTVRQGTKFEVVRASDPRLADGFHDYEETDRLRWTNGHAALPVAPFARFTGAMELVLTLAQTTDYPDDAARVGSVAA
jgi:Hint domain